MQVHAYTFGRAGITVRRGYIEVGTSSEKSSWVPVVDEISRGPLGRFWVWLTGRYTLTSATVDYKGGRISLRSRADDSSRATHALILLNPAARYLGLRRVEVRLPSGVEILRQVGNGNGRVRELLVLAPIGSEMRFKIEFVPVEMASGPDMMSPLAGAFLPELEVSFTLKVGEDGKVTETQ